MTAGSRLKAKGRQAQGSRARVLIAEGGVLQWLPNGLHARSGDHDGVGHVAGLLIKEKRKTQEASGKKTGGRIIPTLGGNTEIIPSADKICIKPTGQ